MDTVRSKTFCSSFHCAPTPPQILLTIIAVAALCFSVSGPSLNFPLSATYALAGVSVISLLGIVIECCRRSSQKPSSPPLPERKEDPTVDKPSTSLSSRREENVAPISSKVNEKTTSGTSGVHENAAPVTSSVHKNAVPVTSNVDEKAATSSSLTSAPLTPWQKEAFVYARSVGIKEDLDSCSPEQEAIFDYFLNSYYVALKENQAHGLRTISPLDMVREYANVCMKVGYALNMLILKQLEEKRSPDFFPKDGSRLRIFSKFRNFFSDVRYGLIPSGAEGAVKVCPIFTQGSYNKFQEKGSEQNNWLLLFNNFCDTARKQIDSRFFPSSDEERIFMESTTRMV